MQFRNLSVQMKTNLRFFLFFEVEAVEDLCYLMCSKVTAFKLNVFVGSL